MKILVVCGAGASSTFVASKLRKVAGDRGLSVKVEAGSESQLERQLADVDVVLVGAHLADRELDLRSRAAASGVRLAFLPALAPAHLSGDVALDLAIDAMGAAL